VTGAERAQDRKLRCAEDHLPAEQLRQDHQRHNPGQRGEGSQRHRIGPHRPLSDGYCMVGAADGHGPAGG
jgi:hypothetical protein